MHSFDFSVDSQLRVVEINGELKNARTSNNESLLGHTYYEVLPLIFHDGSEAVQQVVRDRVAVTLKDYRFACCHQAFSADIEIHPLVEEAASTARAQVRILLRDGCALDARLKNSQHLIDIGKHAAILSHGIRNPLNAIKGAVVYLKKRYQHESTLLEFTEIMEEEISRLDRFITKFLSASLGDTEKETADLNELLRRLEILTTMQSRATGVEVRFEYGEVLPLRINSFQVEHAIHNVINNAFHALSSGGKITVESRIETRAGRSFAVVEIADNGPGIRLRSGESYSGPLADTARAKGKGFGLFITREIMQGHGGMLEIRRGEDAGTSIRLCFPLENMEETI